MRAGKSLSLTDKRLLSVKSAGILSLAESAEALEEKHTTWEKELERLKSQKAHEHASRDALIAERQHKVADRASKRMLEVSQIEEEERLRTLERLRQEDEARSAERKRAHLAAVEAERLRSVRESARRQERCRQHEQHDEEARQKLQALQANLEHATSRMMQQQQSRDARLAERSKAYQQRRAAVEAQLAERNAQREAQERQWRAAMEARFQHCKEAIDSSRMSMTQRSLRNSSAFGNTTRAWKQMLEEESRQRREHHTLAETNSARRLSERRDHERRARSEAGLHHRRVVEQTLSSKQQLDHKREAHMVAISNAVDEKNASIRQFRQQDEAARQARVRNAYAIGSMMKEVERGMLVKNMPPQEVRSQLPSI